MQLRLFNCCESEQNIDTNIDKINMTFQHIFYRLGPCSWDPILL